MRIQLGLKVWSTNLELIEEATRLHREGELDYVEVFCVPDSPAEVSKAWADAQLPYIIHAPHSMVGLNFSLPEMAARNAELACQCYRMADRLQAGVVIFHPGVRGNLDETIRQAKAVRDPRMIFENKPREGLDGSICVGSSVEEIARLTEALGLGFCLDFGHAVAASNSWKADLRSFLEGFTKLGPAMYHLTDGDINGRLDRHDAYGSGSFPLGYFLSLVPDGMRITDEAKRNDPKSLAEYSADREYVRALLAG